MTVEQGVVFTILACTMVLFIWGRIRYDLVAVMALLASVFTGIVPAEKAFIGFSNAAVVTVAAVLVISKALEKSGIVNYLVRLLAPTRTTTTLQVAAGSTLGAALSCVMNNVGALALMLPVVLRNALKAGRSPSLVLIPLSFASLLGGLITLIGTPPNIVISGFREELTDQPFAMFDFTPVGLAVAAAGLLYLATVGWRLLPARVSGEGTEDGLFHIEYYSLETNIPPGSPLDGIQVRDLEALCEDEVSVVALIRNGDRRLAPRSTAVMRENDILILQGDPALIQPLADGERLGELGIQPAGEEAKAAAGTDAQDGEPKPDVTAVSGEAVVIEAVVMPNSPIEGLSMRDVRLHDRFGINLLALSRHGRPTTARIKNVRFKTGDILLMQGERLAMEEALSKLGCLILGDRELEDSQSGRKALLSVAIFAAAIIAASASLTTVPIAFTTAVVALILTRTISLADAYGSIEWPVIFLLAALIPIGKALQQTGGTDLIAQAMIGTAGDIPPWVMLAIVITISMWLSDLIHNTPAAILMAPIAISIASVLSLNPDAFLMAVAVGAASPYLTPIGHQSNTLVMNPGGYEFIDYARVGFLLEILIVATATPMIMWVWPLV